MEIIKIEVDDFTDYDECNTNYFSIGNVIKYNKVDYLILKILNCMPLYDAGIRVEMEVERLSNL